MNIQKIPITQLNPAKYNPRKDLKPGDPEYEKLKRSIGEFGYIEPVIWNSRTGNIVGGHQRFKILKAEGNTEIDVVVVELDEIKEKALNVALNKISGEWDIPLLTELFQDISGSSTRSMAAEVAASVLGGSVSREGDHYDTHRVTTADGRVWQFKSDSSITCRRRLNGQMIDADRSYSVELVSPILTYRTDIDNLQTLVRQLRAAGAFCSSTCGIHIHLDGAAHTARSIRNFVNIVASKNDLFYKALEIEPARMTYCKKMDEYMVTKMNAPKPKNLAQIEKIWYAGYYGENQNGHYHSSRYHFLNLHSFFTGNHTVELRGFNGTLHAGKIRSYIVLALALNNQALTQKSASSRKPQTENEKFAMRTYLNRIGFIGDEFKNYREHLTAHLDGCAAWRFRAA